MRLLALDTATEASSVSLLDGEVAVSRFSEGSRGHAQQILSMIDEVLAEAQIALTMLDGIAASVGPGSFTGVRISVAVAQGVAFGADLPVVPISTLEALAWQIMARGHSHALACLDARMGEVYWGSFLSDPERGVLACAAPRVSPPHAVAVPQGNSDRFQGIGRGFAAYPPLALTPGVDVAAADTHALPHAQDMARIGSLRLTAGGGMDAALLAPLYLRDKVALTEAERRTAKGI